MGRAERKNKSYLAIAYGEETFIYLKYLKLKIYFYVDGFHPYGIGMKSINIKINFQFRSNS